MTYTTVAKFVSVPTRQNSADDVIHIHIYCPVFVPLYCRLPCSSRSRIRSAAPVCRSNEATHISTHIICTNTSSQKRTAHGLQTVSNRLSRFYPSYCRLLSPCSVVCSIRHVQGIRSAAKVDRSNKAMPISTHVCTKSIFQKACSAWSI